MNEKQALEDSQLEVFEHNKCAIAEAIGYLEAIEKGQKLARVIAYRFRNGMNDHSFKKLEDAYDEWEKDK